MRCLKLAIVLLLASSVVMADETKIPEPFRGENAGSPIYINYDDWSLILRSTVMGFKRSGRGRGVSSSVAAPTGSRVAKSNTKDTRNDGNRINLKILAREDNLETITVIRESLEQIPSELPMKHWHKKEQLAYWLNLHNVALIEQLAKEYPFRKMKKMKNNKKGIWQRKILNVAGVPLSLNDIQHNILPNKWDTTLVMYGLFQGFIGGPSIQKMAFTRDNVQKLLMKSAREFVNSNRGMKASGKNLKVSEFYKENKALFPNWKEDVKKHIMHLSEDRMKSRVHATSKLKTMSMDYQTTDLFAGGQMFNTSQADNPAALAFANQSAFDDGGAPSGSRTAPTPIIHSLANWSKQAHMNFRLPDVTREYLRQMRKERLNNEGEIRIEQVGDGETGESGN